MQSANFVSPNRHTLSPPADELKAAAESVLGTRARVAARLDFGNVNGVYRVEAGGSAYALKVFSHAEWPEPGKLPWVEASLARACVRSARMIHYTREASHFPHGFSLSEFVEGENCKAAVRRGSLAPAAYMELAGAVLRQVHSVGLPLYGYIGDGRGTCEDFPGWLLDCDVKDSLRRIDEATVETLYPLIARKVEPVLRRYESRFRPALVHGDCTPKNALLTSDGGLVFVDWDDAVGGFWVRDYAGLTYWYSYMRVGGGGYGDAGLDEARAAFFRGYGEPGFDADELCEIEWALHVSMAAGEMSYLHAFGDAPASARSRGLLTRLLDTPPARGVRDIK